MIRTNEALLLLSTYARHARQAHPPHISLKSHRMLILAWPHEFLIYIARAGLTTDWPGFIHTVIQLNIRFYGRQVEKQKETRQTRHPSYPATNDRIASSRNPALVERSHTRTETRSLSNIFSKTVSTYPRGPISVEERERRMRDNLGLRGGQAVI